MQSSREINDAVLKAGKKSLEIIQGFLSGRVTKENLLSGLTELNANEILTKHWGVLTSNPVYMPHWHVLETLQGIVSEMQYQLAEYGEGTMYDDMKEIAINLKRISEQSSF